MSLRTINQNLLPILLALLRERNVTRAAQSIGLTQSAVSKALIQLRAILGDELLVQVSRSLVLTKRGEELLGPVAAICDELDSLWRPHTFDPATSTREFVIAGADYCAMLMVPALASSLAKLAPHVSLRFVDLVPQLLLDERADIDFAMAPTLSIPKQLIEAERTLPLFIDEFVAVVAKTHPLAAEKCVSRKEFASIKHIAFGHPVIPQTSRTERLSDDDAAAILAIVPQFIALPLLAALTGAAAIVPRRLVELISANFPLHILEGAAPELRVDMSLAWHKRREGDPDHRWFRALVAKHLQDDRFR